MSADFASTADLTDKTITSDAIGPDLYAIMPKLVAASHLADPDAAYVALVKARRNLSEAQAAALDARLVLILANHIGDLDVPRHRAGEAKPLGKSARALDGDELVAMGATAGAGGARRDRAGNVVTIDLAIGQRVAELVVAAVRIRRRYAAGRARCQAKVDAVAVDVVGDDEDALFRLRGGCTKQHSGKSGRRDHGTHGTPSRRRKRRNPRCYKHEECDGGVKAVLTPRSALPSAAPAPPIR